ncbi:hypothetical protein KKB40_04115, partial [Patescibacteria group bacterium]|nr:hypothetical protein [Patescibacteria group bacterium]
GINIYLYFLLPLSSYLNLINPYYMEISHWEEDLGIVLENLETDSLTLAKPAASFKLSQFGEKLFSLLVK